MCVLNFDNLSLASKIKKHTIRIYGHNTSVTLETAFWEYLKVIAAQNNITLSNLIEKIDLKHSGNLSSTLRVFILKYLQTNQTINLLN